jgi:hypothetical protein
MKFILSILAVMLLALTGAVAEPVNATDLPTLQITPAHSNLHLTPGSAKYQTITATNKSDQEITIRVYVETYGQNSASNRSQIIRWLKFEQEQYTVAANQTIEINYNVHVPFDVAYGDQAAVIYVEKMTSEIAGQTGAITVPRAGSVLKATISGDTRDGITVSDLSLPPAILNSQTDFIASSKVSNIGNTDLDTFFRLEVKNFFGQILYDKEITAVIESGTEHTITQKWEEAPAIGFLSVRYNVSAFGKHEELTRLILIVPIWAVIASLIVAVIATTLIVYHLVRRKTIHAKSAKNN